MFENPTTDSEVKQTLSFPTSTKNKLARGVETFQTDLNTHSEDGLLLISFSIYFCV